MTTKELTLKLDRARWYALRELPFYGTLAMGLTDVITDAGPFAHWPAGMKKTACTDGRKIYWHPEFLENLPDEECRFTLLHETMHPTHGHNWRLPADQRGNKAGDYAINAILSKIPGLTMPKGGLLDSAYDGLAEEEILARLPDDPPGKGNGGNGNDDGQTGTDPGGCGGFLPPPPDQQPGNGQGQPQDSLRDQWERRVIQAQQAAAAMGQGDLPADLARIIERVKAQELDWRAETADFLRSAIATRNDWTRAARRHAWQSVLYPRKRADQIGKVIVALDVSGSVSTETLAEFSAHAVSCLAELGATGILLYCDSDIQQEIELTPGEEPPLTTLGGGGTSHLPIWARAAELREQGEHIAGIVAITDLATDFPPDADNFATLWLSTTTQQAPFGRTIHIK